MPTMRQDWKADAVLDLNDTGRTLRRLHNPVITREKVLLVEDDQLLCEGMSEHLDARGFDVTTVRDGITAIELLLTKDFDVMLLDLGIPRMSGAKLLHEIRREPEIPRIPIVLLTGSDDEEVEKADNNLELTSFLFSFKV